MLDSLEVSIAFVGLLLSFPFSSDISWGQNTWACAAGSLVLPLRPALAFMVLKCKKSRAARPAEVMAEQCRVLLNCAIGSVAPLIGVFVPFLEKTFYRLIRFQYEKKHQALPLVELTNFDGFWTVTCK
jgi:hypothetical protein